MTEIQEEENFGSAFVGTGIIIALGVAVLVPVASSSSAIIIDSFAGNIDSVMASMPQIEANLTTVMNAGFGLSGVLIIAGVAEIAKQGILSDTCKYIEDKIDYCKTVLNIDINDNNEPLMGEPMSESISIEMK